MRISSSVLRNNSEISIRYTGEGENVSPPLEWSDGPQGCKSFAVICEDPDASVRSGHDHPFVHWLIYNIANTVTSLPEGLPMEAQINLPLKATQGKNSFGSVGYHGPQPPEGHGAHHYIFKAMALSKACTLPSAMDMTAFKKEIESFILDSATLTVKYTRQPRRRAAYG